MANTTTTTPRQANARIKKAARAAGYDVQSVRTGTGSLRGHTIVQLPVDRDLDQMKALAKWLRAEYPGQAFDGDVHPCTFTS